MADHYGKACDLVNEVEVITDLLSAEHAAPIPDRRVLGRLNQDLGVSLKLAGIHAELATASALHDVRQAIEAGK